jgi:hypothetical protein
MSKRALTILGVVLAAVMILAGTGYLAYHAGVTQGLSQTGATPPPYWGHGHRWHPHPFGFVLPLLALIFGFALLRRALWGGYCGGRHWGGHYWGDRHWDDYGPWGRGVPPGFAEWHRRAHESPESSREAPGEGPRDTPRGGTPPSPGPAR